MNDLATWLLEQIAEDEAQARAATKFNSASWSCPSSAVLDTGAKGLDGLLPASDRELTEHMARWDPARVLAECDAKRRRVAWHQPAEPGIGPGDPRCKTCVVWAQWPHVEAGPLPYPCPSLRLEALPYADRDGYREEWRS